MSDAPDAKLLEQFVRFQSEGAFAELVQRYIGLVYSTAFRKAENPQHAQDITQAVFIIFAGKAGSLRPKTVLAGWFYHTAWLTAANFQRAEMRRIRREQEAFMQSTMNEPAPDALWLELAPLLDDAMADLGASDRDAIVLRFFQKRSMADVGVALGASEGAAKMRVNRALEKLRKFFTKRGVASTATAIAGVITGNSVQAVPASLANTISTVALAKGAAVSASTWALAKGTLKMMAWAKAKTAIAVGGVAVLTAGTAILAAKMFLSPARPPQSPLTDLLNSLHATRERFGNPLVGPVRTIGIRLEQHLSTADLLTGSLELPDDMLKLKPFLIRKSNDILLLHGNLLVPCNI